MTIGTTVISPKSMQQGHRDSLCASLCVCFCHTFTLTLSDILTHARAHVRTCARAQCTVQATPPTLRAGFIFSLITLSSPPHTHTPSCTQSRVYFHQNGSTKIYAASVAHYGRIVFSLLSLLSSLSSLPRGAISTFLVPLSRTGIFLRAQHTRACARSTGARLPTPGIFLYHHVKSVGGEIWQVFLPQKMSFLDAVGRHCAK